MSLTPEEYINLRTDIAELRGIVTGSLSGVQTAQAETKTAIERVHQEFDMVHKRYNEVAKTVAVHETEISTLKERDGRGRSNVALWISAGGVIIALASKITWA